MKNDQTENSISDNDNNVIAGARNEEQLNEFNENAANGRDEELLNASNIDNEERSSENEKVVPESGTDLGGITNLSLDQLKERGDNNS